MNHATTLRSLQLAARKATRNSTSALRAAFEPMETRQMMSATAVKAVDSAGPDDQMLTVAGTVYVISSTASGGGWSQIYSSKGGPTTTKHLLDLNKSGATIGSLETLVGTADGRVFFTATGGTGGGRQLFLLNTTKGGYTQVTQDTQAYYAQAMVIGNKLFLYDSTHERIVTLDSKNKTHTVVDTPVGTLFQAKGQLFYTNGDQGVWRSDGTAEGTYKISGDLTVGTRDIFVSNDYIYFSGTVNSLTSLYRADGGNAAPTKLAEDFNLLNHSSAEIGDYVYFSGGYYNTSPKGGDGFQLCRVKTSTGEVSLAAVINDGPDGAGRADALYALGTNVYYTAGDGDYLTSQGTTDRELYRYDTVTGVNKKVTTGEQLAPVDDVGNGGGAGVLGSYYFTASPTKDDFRFGARKLYRTSPSDDAIEEVTALPGLKYGSNVVEGFAVGAAGLFANVDIDDGSHDSDTFFVPTPYTYVDPATQTLIVTGTDSADTMTLKTDGDELVFNLNGVEERRQIGTFGGIRITLRDGDDKFTADANVTLGMYVTGDSGNDEIHGGSGNDNLLGGAGKNKLYGGAGNDRLRGGGGQDYCYGEAGNDRLYGYGGSDFLGGGDGVDYLYGDDVTGVQGNDTLYGGSGKDRLYGRGGNDFLDGGKQADELYGGDGDDTLQGQDGDDTLEGSAGSDLIYGGADDDTIANETDGAADQIFGGDGTDTLLGHDASDKVDALVEAVN